MRHKAVRRGEVAVALQKALAEGAASIIASRCEEASQGAGLADTKVQKAPTRRAEPMYNLDSG